jgi:proteasome accessory factor C
MVDVLDLLRNHPEGLPIDRVAAELGVAREVLDTDLAEFYATDVGALTTLGFDVPPIEFLTAPADADADATGEPGDEWDSIADADVVRLTRSNPFEIVGLDYFRADVLGVLFRAASALTAIEPDNAVLAAAVTKMQRSLLGASGDVGGGDSDSAALLRDAVATQHKVAITYQRQWYPGVFDRVIEPYRVIETRRGFEVDAGPLDEGGEIRTYLLSGVRRCEVLDKTFVRPDDVDAAIERARATRIVKFVVPVERREVVERFAESTRAGGADEMIEIEAEVLPPYGDRVGLMLLLAGPDAFVVDAPDLEDSGAAMARRLLDLHGLV